MIAIIYLQYRIFASLFLTLVFFFLNDPPPTEFSPLPLPAALPTPRARGTAAARLDPGPIDPKAIGDRLWTEGLPPLELVVRTSGELRVSNFLLWQLAYSEIHFTDALWPDFGELDLLLALEDFQKRERRFGKTSAQIRTSA